MEYRLSMFGKFFLFIFLLSGSCMFAKAQQGSREEFNGPFNSWVSVFTFGAIGNGKNDDSKSFQLALDQLFDERTKGNGQMKNAYSVLYIPKGTYRLTRPLVIKGKVGFVIIGEDPASTILYYDGPDNNTILYGNGSSYFRIARLQFNSRNKKNITAIGIHWKAELTTSNSYAPQAMEIAECIFKNGIARGIAGGKFNATEKDATCSEVSIRNCHFYDCTESGISVNGYNALNYWIWNCRFFDCKIGVENRFGNSYVYRSYFKRSTKTDVYNNHGYYSSIRGCYSDSSNYFYLDNGYSCNAFKRVMEGNVIKNTLSWSIEYSDFGYITLLNNFFFRNHHKTWKMAVNLVTRNAVCQPAEYRIFSIGNFYEMEQPFRINKELTDQYDYTTGDYGFGKQSPKLDEKKFLNDILIPFVPKVNRRIFEVQPNASGAQIQRIINEASSSEWRGKRPVVHLPLGRYDIAETIVIPAGSDIQLVGDGFLRATVLRATPSLKGKYFFRVKGPTAVYFREMQIGTETGKAEDLYGIMLENVDQPGSQVFIDQMRVGSDANALHTNKLKNTYIQKTNSFYAFKDIIEGSTAVNTDKVSSTVNLFGGQFGYFSLSNSASYFVKDSWFEGSMKEKLPVQLQGNCNVVLDCVRLGVYEKGNKPGVQIKDFNGKFLLMNAFVDNTLFLNLKDSKGSILLMNLYMNFPAQVLNASTNKQFSMIGVVNGNNNQPRVAAKDLSDKQNTRALMKAMTDYTRDKLPRYYTNKPADITNSYFSRINFGNLRKAFFIQP